MKWVSFALVLIAVLAGLWYFGVAQEIGDAFDGWLRWIGAR